MVEVKFNAIWSCCAHLNSGGVHDEIECKEYFRIKFELMQLGILNWLDSTQSACSFLKTYFI